MSNQNLLFSKTLPTEELISHLGCKIKSSTFVVDLVLR